MNIKCLFGKHDWEETECVSEKFVAGNLLEERFKKYAVERIETEKSILKGRVPANYLDRRLKRYVCLRKNCCAIKDEIKEFLDYWKKKGLEEIKKGNKKIKRNSEAIKKFNRCLEKKGDHNAI